MVDSLRMDSLSFARMISYNLNASSSCREMSLHGNHCICMCMCLLYRSRKHTLAFSMEVPDTKQTYLLLVNESSSVSSAGATFAIDDLRCECLAHLWIMHHC